MKGLEAFKEAVSGIAGEILPKLAGLIKGNMASITFILGIVLNWYVLIVGTAIVVTYNFLQGVKESGAYDAVFGFLEEKLGYLVYLSEECSVKIIKITEFINCLNVN